MLIERFGTTEIVKFFRHEPRLFTQLSQRRLHGRFAGLDSAVNRLPRAGTAPPPVAAAAQNEDFEPVTRAAQGVGVHEHHACLGQRRLPRTASRRAESARARNGLVRKSSAPSSKTRTSLSSSPFAVSTITGMFAVAGRERRWDSTP